MHLRKIRVIAGPWSPVNQAEGGDKRPDMSSYNSCRSWPLAEGVWEAGGDRSDGRSGNQGNDRAVPVNFSVVSGSKECRRMGFSKRDFHYDRIAPTKMKNHWVALS